MDMFKQINLDRIPVKTRVLLILYFLTKIGVVRFDMNNSEHRNCLKTVLSWINERNSELVAQGATSCTERITLALISYNIVKYVIPADKKE